MRTMTPGFRSVLSNTHFTAAPPPHFQVEVGQRVSVQPRVDAELAGTPGTVTARFPEVPGFIVVQFDEGSALEVSPSDLIDWEV